MIDRRLVERWIAWLRLSGVVFAIVEVAAFSPGRPTGYEVPQWALTGAFAVGALVLFYAARNVDDARLEPVGFAALLFDTAVIGAFAFMYAYEYGNQTRWALILVVVEGALRFGLPGGIVVPIALTPYFALNEWWRSREWGPPGFITDRVTFPTGITLLTGLIVGWLVQRLRTSAAFSVERAAEAERLRDELGRRVDVLEAVNRCARALGSSLEIDQAFGVFIRELRGLVNFERTAIVLVEGETAQTMATAGRGASTVFPPGTVGPLRGSVLERVLDGELVMRRDLTESEYPADGKLIQLGLRSELVAPLMLGARPIGMISISRAEVDAFSADEGELFALLGRLVATAVQNIRAYESERKTTAELRRLSALRADFVSLVSHELRSPMAAVIGAARTLQDRWRTLTVEQRDAFLALIGDETNRLAALIGDVLDTSRIEAGTFSYSFTDVDLGRLVNDAVATASVGQDEVRVHAEVGKLPLVRGDRERLRQVITNLIDNAIKYSPAGDEVRVVASPENGAIRIAVTDHGPGIPQDQQRLIFEKFGRADVPGGSKPGTGLGLFIARSIAEAHGGTVDVSSRPSEGATFVLTLPVTRS
ncbi:MAG TPA: ATP-binding protein [Gaiellaceae bacterium]|nr:ATP-binding protein [Gaiellaceae bacterium]